MSARWRIPNARALESVIQGDRISTAELRRVLSGSVSAGPMVSAVPMSDPLVRLRERLINLIQRLPPRDPECPHERELMRFLNGDAKTVSHFESSQEHLEQTAFFYSLKRFAPDLYDLTFSVPNGGSRRKGEGFRLQAEGQKPGIPDVLIVKKTERYVGLAIEFKRSNGRLSDVTDEQRAMHSRMELEGWRVVVAFGFGEALRAVREYMRLPDTEKWRY